MAGLKRCASQSGHCNRQPLHWQSWHVLSQTPVGSSCPLPYQILIAAHLRNFKGKPKRSKGGTPKFDGRMHFFLHNRLTLSMSGLCYAAWEFYRLGKKAGNGSSRGCARTGLDRVLQSSCQIGQLRLQWQLWVAEILPE